MTSKSDPDTAPRSHRARSELIFASIWLAVGFFVMPAVIYLVGTLLLGPYGVAEGEGAGLGSFYGDFFSDLIEPAGRVWILALGPLAVISAIRLIFWNFKSRVSEEPRESRDTFEAAPPREPARRTRERVEPRVSAD